MLFLDVILITWYRMRFMALSRSIKMSRLNVVRPIKQDSVLASFAKRQETKKMSTVLCLQKMPTMHLFFIGTERKMTIDQLLMRGNDWLEAGMCIFSPRRCQEVLKMKQDFCTVCMRNIVFPEMMVNRCVTIPANICVAAPATTCVAAPATTCVAPPICPPRQLCGTRWS